MKKMKRGQLSKLTSAALVTIAMAAPAWAQSSSTITEPLGGKPPVGSKPSVEDLTDQVTYQRAFEAVIWSMPAVAKYGLHRATFDMGAGNNVVLAWSAGARPLFEALTPNNTTPYVNATTDLRPGPVVVEVPPATGKASLFGQIADHWYITIVDIGPIGLDKGQGGKFLLIPPGYEGDLPSGYIEVKSPSFILDFAFRSIPTPDGTPQDAYELGQRLKMYYLSELPSPKPTKFVDPLDMRWPTLCRYDERWFEDLHTVIDVEPVRDRDKAMMGLLKHIGIEKGKPYSPDAKTKEIFRRAAADAYYYMQQRYLTVEPEELYWPDRHWRNVFYSDPNMGFSWDWEGMLDYDNRSVHPWFTAIYFPAKVTARPPTMYLATARDKDGKLFEAGKTYKLTVPKDVPIDKFWSLTIYDMETWAFIYTKEQRPGLSSREIPGMKKNADGSVTLYVGPKAPPGLENNWIPTAGKTPYLMFRFYGPEEAFYNKTFKLEDVELAE